MLRLGGNEEGSSTVFGDVFGSVSGEIEIIGGLLLGKLSDCCFFKIDGGYELVAIELLEPFLVLSLLLICSKESIMDAVFQPF